MSANRTDHPVAAATGALAGAAAGVAVGAVGGPVGMVAGAAVGGIVGAAAGDGIAEAVNPTAYGDYWKHNYAFKPYFVSGREWADYEPAYLYGYESFSAHRGRKFSEIETELERKWEATRGKSRLLWADAKDAVRDGWHYVERAVTGDSNRATR